MGRIVRLLGMYRELWGTSLFDCFSVICQALSMLRQPRLDIPDLLHHVMVRGIERRVIFTDNTDYTNFVERLRKLLPVGR